MPKPYKAYTIGDKVKATHYLTRVYNEGISPEITWEPMPFGKDVEGIYIGYRYKQEGSIRPWVGCDGFDDPNEWQQCGNILCALIVTSPRKEPTPVPFNALWKI